MNITSPPTATMAKVAGGGGGGQKPDLTIQNII